MHILGAYSVVDSSQSKTIMGMNLKDVHTHLYTIGHTSPFLLGQKLLKKVASKIEL